MPNRLRRPEGPQVFQREDDIATEDFASKLDDVFGVRRRQNFANFAQSLVGSFFCK